MGGLFGMLIATILCHLNPQWSLMLVLFGLGIGFLVEMSLFARFLIKGEHRVRQQNFHGLRRT